MTSADNAASMALRTSRDLPQGRDEHLATLRKAYPAPWKFERLASGRILARHRGYSVEGDNPGQVGRAIVEWMSNTGLTGDGRAASMTGS